MPCMSGQWLREREKVLNGANGVFLLTYAGENFFFFLILQKLKRKILYPLLYTAYVCVCVSIYTHTWKYMENE